MVYSSTSESNYCSVHSFDYIFFTPNPKPVPDVLVGKIGFKNPTFSMEYLHTLSFIEIMSSVSKSLY